MPAIKLRIQHQHNRNMQINQQNINKNKNNQQSYQKVNTNELKNKQKLSVQILSNNNDTTNINKINLINNTNNETNKLIKQKQFLSNNETIIHTRQIKQPKSNKIIKNLPQQTLTLTKNNNQPVQQVKKKKKKKHQIEQQILSPQQIKNIRSNKIYKQFLNRNQINQSNNEQLNILLKESLYRLTQLSNININNNEVQQKHNIYSEQIKYHIIDSIYKKKSFNQQRIYYGIIQQNYLFNDLIWRQQIESAIKKQQILNLFNQIHTHLIHDIDSGVYQIQFKQKTSKDLIIYGKYQAEQIKLAENIIKDKLSHLNQEFNINQFENQHHYKKFALDSQQTKKAQQFIKKLNQQQKIIKNNIKKIKQHQFLLQQKQLQQKKLLQQKQRQLMKQQKRIKIQKRIQQKQKQKQQRLKYFQQIKKENIQNKQKIPLYLKKQQDFKKILIKQHIRKIQLMNELRKNKRSIPKQQIEAHMAKYKQLKQLLQQQRQQMLRLKEQQNQYHKTYFKGHFFQYISNQPDRKTLQQQKRNKTYQLYEKKNQYSTLIKNKFIPKIDQKKKQQLEILKINSQRKNKNDNYIAQKIKMEGYRNLQKLHMFIGQLKAKGKIKKEQINQNQTDQQNQIKKSNSRYINYLNDIKTNRSINSSFNSTKNKFKSLDISRIDNKQISRSQMGMIQFKAKKLQHLADRKSIFLKNNKNLDIQEYMEKKFELEDQYLQSAKVKLKVLNKYQLE